MSWYGKHWGYLAQEAMTEARLTPEAKVLYGLLTTLVNDDGVTHVSNVDLAKMLNTNPRLITNWVRELELSDWLTRVPNPGYANTTILQWIYAEFVSLEQQMVQDETSGADL